METLQRMRTAVVGCGMISNIYLKNLTNTFSIIDVVAVCDVCPEAAESKAKTYGIPKVMTLDEVMGSDEIELVVNLTGPAQHYEIIKRALESGKHVYTEKMLCAEFEQGREVVELAKEKGLYLGCAPDTFLGAGLQTARKVLETGLIGQAVSCLAAINRNQLINSETYGYMRFPGGAFPYDVGVYYVTALLSLFGPIDKIAGFGIPAPVHVGRNIWNGNYGREWQIPGNNSVAASVLFKNGMIGSIHFEGNGMNEEHPYLVIYGTEGMLLLGNPDHYDGSVTLIRNGEGQCEIPFTHGFKGTDLLGEPSAFDWGGHRGIGPAEMAWSIRKGRQHRATGEMGLHTLEVLTGIDQTSASGQVYQMTTSFPIPRPLPTGYLGRELGGFLRADAEAALTL